MNKQPFSEDQSAQPERPSNRKEIQVFQLTSFKKQQIPQKIRLFLDQKFETKTLTHKNPINLVYSANGSRILKLFWWSNCYSRSDEDDINEKKLLEYLGVKPTTTSKESISKAVPTQGIPSESPLPNIIRKTSDSWDSKSEYYWVLE